jgi:hypothetical protein
MIVFILNYVHLLDFGPLKQDYNKKKLYGSY